MPLPFTGFFRGLEADSHDPGGSMRLPLLPGVIGSAGYVNGMPAHRLWLERKWGDKVGFLLAIGMNPSMGEADVDDLTLRKDQGYAQRFGFESLIKCNIGSFRSTDPAGLDATHQPAHPENLPTIFRYASCEPIIILMCCGNLPPSLVQEGRNVYMALRTLGKPLWHLGLTKAGYPKHTSRLAYNLPLQELTQWPR